MLPLAIFTTASVFEFSRKKRITVNYGWSVSVAVAVGGQQTGHAQLTVHGNGRQNPIRFMVLEKASGSP